MVARIKRRIYFEISYSLVVSKVPWLVAIVILSLCFCECACAVKSNFWVNLIFCWQYLQTAVYSSLGSFCSQSLNSQSHNQSGRYSVLRLFLHFWVSLCSTLLFLEEALVLLSIIAIYKNKKLITEINFKSILTLFKFNKIY